MLRGDRGANVLPKLQASKIVQEEFFDVVDDEDNIIGVASRDEVHQLGLKHRSVHLLVYNSNSQLLLQKRSMRKDQCPGRWCASVSGHVDHGEDYDKCVVREAREEIGLEIGKTPEKLFKIGASEETGNEFSWVYWHSSEGPFTTDQEEVSEIAWFAEEELNKLLSTNPESFTPDLALIWRKLSS